MSVHGKSADSRETRNFARRFTPEEYARQRDNAFIEAFNGLRGGVPGQHWFLTLADAREKMEDWRRDYNPVS